jgi:hypothetical protein
MPIVYSLEDGEKTIIDVSQKDNSALGWWISLGVAGFLFLLMCILATAASKALKIVCIIFAVIFFVCLAIGCVFAVYKMRDSGSCDLIFTDRRVIGKTDKDYIEVYWNGVKKVFIEQNIIGKIFGFGALTIVTERGAMIFRHMHNPQKIKEEAERQIGIAIAAEEEEVSLVSSGY